MNAGALEVCDSSLDFFSVPAVAEAESEQPARGGGDLWYLKTSRGSCDEALEQLWHYFQDVLLFCW